jgi:hypothetical protein
MLVVKEENDMRKQSDATKLRLLKATSNMRIRQLEDANNEFRRRLNLILASGCGMSNICFNFSQQARFTEEEREGFRRCYMEWDRTKKA